MTRLWRLAEELRQRGQHRAFRIAAPDLDRQWWQRLRRAFGELDAAYLADRRLQPGEVIVGGPDHQDQEETRAGSD